MTMTNLNKLRLYVWNYLGEQDFAGFALAIAYSVEEAKESLQKNEWQSQYLTDKEPNLILDIRDNTSYYDEVPKDFVVSSEV